MVCGKSHSFLDDIFSSILLQFFYSRSLLFINSFCSFSDLFYENLFLTLEPLTKNVYVLVSLWSFSEFSVFCVNVCVDNEYHFVVVLSSVTIQMTFVQDSHLCWSDVKLMVECVKKLTNKKMKNKHNNDHDDRDY